MPHSPQSIGRTLPKGSGCERRIGRRWRRAALAVVIGLGVACTESTTDPLVCTKEFRTLAIQVQSSTGEPVLDASIEVRRRDTGSLWPATGSERLIDAVQGWYAVVDDSHLSLIERNEQVPLTISASRSASANAVTSTDWIITSDGCHVSRVTGQDRLIVAGGAN